MRGFPNVKLMYGRFRFWRTMTVVLVIAGCVAVYIDHIGAGFLLWGGAWLTNRAREFWEVRVWGHLQALHTSNPNGDPVARQYLSAADQRKLDKLARDRFKARPPR